MTHFLRFTQLTQLFFLFCQFMPTALPFIKLDLTLAGSITSPLEMASVRFKSSATKPQRAEAGPCFRSVSMARLGLAIGPGSSIKTASVTCPVNTGWDWTGFISWRRIPSRFASISERRMEGDGLPCIKGLRWQPLTKSIL